jgi:hypothetical protein
MTEDEGSKDSEPTAENYISELIATELNKSFIESHIFYLCQYSGVFSTHSPLNIQPNTNQDQSEVLTRT